MKSLEGKSFIATLKWSDKGKSGPVSCSYSILPAQGGWLQPQGEQVELRFEFVEVVKTGLCFRISGAPAAGEYADGKLDLSLKNFMGFYKVSEADNRWVVNVTRQVSDTEFDFDWLDKAGNKVGRKDEFIYQAHGANLIVHYMGVYGSGDTGFHARILKWL